MKGFIYLITGLTVIFGGLFYVSRMHCKTYTCLLFENKQQFKEIDQIENTENSYKGILKNGLLQIRLEIYSAASSEIADRFTQAKVMQLLGLYESARSPYPGVLSNEVVCDEKFKPVVTEKSTKEQKITYITGFLNERLQYGVCIENQIPNKGKTAMFYCSGQKKWYYFEAIAKKSDKNLDYETTHLIQSLRCQKSP
jgi:hypothetical protein